MEDEEFLPEDSDLRRYLEELNLLDAEMGTGVRKKPSNFASVDDSNKINSTNKVGYIDKDVIEQIEELLRARMVFEEDVNNIERLLANFKPIKMSMLRSIFDNISGLITIFLGLCAYWVIGGYVFFMISAFYAYNAADYLWKKHFNQRCVKNLLEILKLNYTLFRKVFKFLNDNDEFVKLTNRGRSRSFEHLPSKCNNYESLKNDFIAVEKEAIAILTRGTKKLISRMPFHENIENPQCYLCNKYEQVFLECVDLSKLYQIYLLVQSEFLQRVALSLIPNIQVSTKGNFMEFNKIVKEVSILIGRLEFKFGEKFKFIFIRGLYENERRFNFARARKPNADPHHHHKIECLKNIQDVSNVFQHLLIKSRTMETTFSSNEFTEKMENDLTEINKKLEMCQVNISETLILLKKICKREKANERDEGIKQFETADIDELGKKIDLELENSTVEDEVFEAYLSSDNPCEINEEYYFDDPVKRKMEEEYSKIVLGELKTKIAERAKEWKEREEKAMKKKGYNDDDDDDDDSNDTESAGEGENDGEGDGDVEKNDIPFWGSNSESDEYSSDGERKAESCPPLSSVSKLNFLANITAARDKLMKPSLVDEYFCYTDEDSDDS